MGNCTKQSIKPVRGESGVGQDEHFEAKRSTAFVAVANKVLGDLRPGGSGLVSCTGHED